MRSVKRPFKRNRQAIIASLLAGLILLLDALAVSPRFHELFHSDAHSTQHQCAVTMFTQGQVDSAAVDIHPVISASFGEFLPLTTFSVYRPTIENLPAGRAPPVSSSNS